MTSLGDVIRARQPDVAEQMRANAGVLWSELPHQTTLDRCRMFEFDLNHRGIEIEVSDRRKIKAFVSAFANAGCATTYVCRRTGVFAKVVHNPQSVNGTIARDDKVVKTAPVSHPVVADKGVPKKLLKAPKKPAVNDKAPVRAVSAKTVIPTAHAIARVLTARGNQDQPPNQNVCRFTYNGKLLPMAWSPIEELIKFGEFCGLEFSETQKSNHRQILGILAKHFLVQPSATSPDQYLEEFAHSIRCEHNLGDTSEKRWFKALVGFCQFSAQRGLTYLWHGRVPRIEVKKVAPHFTLWEKLDNAQRIF